MQHIKCVVVGDGTVGKTCLLIAYTMKAFPREYVPTVFDNYNAVVMWDGRPINLGLWDTAGQDDFQAMRPMSYDNVDIFLMFFALDNPVSFQNIKYKWYPEILKVNKEIPRILVGTKSDCREDQQRLEQLRDKKIKPITYKQGRKLAKEIGCISYIECSAITNKGFRDVFGQTIAALINLRAGKKPGQTCWSTRCSTNLPMLKKNRKCIRCQHQFCHDCLVLLPRGHACENKLICKKCKDIDAEEPTRLEFRKQIKKHRKAGQKGKKKPDGEGDGDASQPAREASESNDGDAVPLSGRVLMSRFYSAATPPPSGKSAAKENGSKKKGKGKEKEKGEEEEEEIAQENGGDEDEESSSSEEDDETTGD